MNKITRQQCEALIDRLTSDTLEKGSLEWALDKILIGDVLEKFPEANAWRSLELRWKPCGISKSIQTIVDESGWRKRYCQQCDVEHRYGDHDTLESPEANSLLVFINNLIK